MVSVQHQLCAQTVCNTEKQLVAHCKQQIAARAPQIQVSIPPNVFNKLDSVMRTITYEGNIVGMQAAAQGRVVTLTPTYSDGQRLSRPANSSTPAQGLSKEDRKVQAKAQSIVNQVKRQYNNPYDQAVALHDYIIANIRYDISANSQQTREVALALLNGRAVCSGYSHTYQLLLNMCGIENTIVGGKALGIVHMWNMVKINGQWMHVDCTFDDPAKDIPGRKTHAYFGLSDKEISRDHTWNRASTPKASSTQLNYFARKGLVFNTVQDYANYALQHSTGREWRKGAYVKELANKRVSLAGYVNRANQSAPHGVHIKQFSQHPKNPAVITFITQGDGPKARQVASDH